MGWCLEGHLLAECSPSHPFLLHTCLNLQALPLVQPLAELKRMQISAPAGVCVTESVAGPNRVKTPGLPKRKE